MYGNQASDIHFNVQTPIEAGFLKPLVNCRQEVLFPKESAIAPMAINLFFPEQSDQDYAELLEKEVSLYAKRFQHRKLSKIWFRGSPLRGMKAGELTELAFHCNLTFPSSSGTVGESGFECEIADVTPGNLALMKGLRFNRILLAMTAAIPPEKQHISGVLDLIDEYRFQERWYRLDARDADPDTLTCWLETLSRHNPDMVEVCHLDDTDTPIPLSRVANLMREHHYQLLGDRFFVTQNHPLLLLQRQNNLQYTPWGLCSVYTTDWLGIGLGALGKLGNGYYQNTDRVERYRNQVSSKQLPVCCSGLYPDCQQKPYPWLLVSQLLCTHSILWPETSEQSSLARTVQNTLENAVSRGWMQRDQERLTLTESGLDHLHTLCRILQES